MPKVTYLLGAGASANCLPTVDGIPAELIKFREELVHLVLDPSELLGLMHEFTISSARDAMVEDCIKLHMMAADHASIDTYAKKLYIKKLRADYLSLKAITSCLFIYLQTVNKQNPEKENPGDYRYDSFFASILGDDSMDFNNDVRIVSWNYDFQLERAFSQYSMQKSMKENQQLLHVYPDGIRTEHYQDRFSILKINGTTSFINNNKQGYPEHPVDNFELIDKAKLLKQLIWYYTASIQRPKIIKPMLSFAWENFPSDKPENIINTAAKSIERSIALVIIGYSFPFFNRKVDKAIISAACSTPYQTKKTKIYVQDINPENIITRLQSVFPEGYPEENIIPIKAIDPRIDKLTKDQFYLPAEL